MATGRLTSGLYPFSWQRCLPAECHALLFLSPVAEILQDPTGRQGCAIKGPRPLKQAHCIQRVVGDESPYHK